MHGTMKEISDGTGGVTRATVVDRDEADAWRGEDGFVITPPPVVDRMVAQLFAEGPLTPASRVLDPGCGEGEFIGGVLRYCAAAGVRPPQVVGVERDPERAGAAAKRFAGCPTIRVENRDFLRPSHERFTHIVGNPPYVSILGIPEAERARLRTAYESARGRFDLYMLFFEQSLRMLNPGGRLVFVTPEKFLYTRSARGLRIVLARHQVETVELISEQTFPGRTSYPAITVVNALPQIRPTTGIRNREGRLLLAVFQPSGDPVPLEPSSTRSPAKGGQVTLGDLCIRISAGVATGADGLFVLPRASVAGDLEAYAYPTIAGKQLVIGQPPAPTDAMLIPYDNDGRLLPLGKLGAFERRLEQQKIQLLKRSCVNRKPWYAFHDNLPFDGMLRPKLLTKDITKVPAFWIDRTGDIVPRHSVYYLTPRDPSVLGMLAEYLARPEPGAWLLANCQRAANGFLRVQSDALQRLPLPSSFDGMAL